MAPFDMFINNKPSYMMFVIKKLTNEMCHHNEQNSKL